MAFPHRRLNHKFTSNTLRPLLFSVITFLVLHGAYSWQVSGAQSMQLSKVEVIGLKRISHEQVMTASGLKIGQSVNVDVVDAAANQLLSSGLFKKLSYRLRGAGGQAIVTFEVEETVGGAPVVFDNLVWFSEEELTDAIRRELPSFDGTAPESGDVPDTIAKALQKLLDERKIMGRVEYMPSANLAGGNAKHIFSVKGVHLPICALQFPGAAGVQTSELVKNSQSLLGNDYSKEFVASFAQAKLIPLYTQRGHLRAAFKTPAAQPANDSNCKDGVNVTLPVEEGLIYSWEKAEWSGNETLSVTELESALGMKTGELASSLKIDAGFKSVREAYGRKGFIMARLSPKQSFEDATRRVTYVIALNEGPQFRMGNLIIRGVSEADANYFKEKWKLRQGEVYNESYLGEFIKNSLPGFMMRIGPGAGRISTEIKPDRQNLTVDVIVNLKK